jgi:putative ABC transport system permease protein
MEILQIALRNVFRNPRRTILNLVAIGVGVMIILTMKGWIGGLSATAYSTQIDLDTGHVQVLAEGYQDEARRLPLDLRVKDWQAVKKAITALPGVVGTSARLDFAGQITNGETAFNVAFRGVDPEGSAAVTTLPAAVKEGAWLADENAVMVGSGLARKLGLQVGDQVFLTALDQYGVRNLVDGKVGGIFTSGFGIFDDSVVFLTLKKAQALGPGDATRVVVRFQNIDDLDGRVRQVRQALETAGLGKAAGLTADSWRVFAKSLVDTIESRIKIFSVMMGLLILMVAIGILNSMSMAVQERFREIGTLRAIGMNRRKLERMFLAEGFLLGLAGGLAGLCGAGVLAWLGTTFGLDAQGFLPREVPIPLVSVLRPVYSPLDFPLVAFFAALVATVGSLLPSRRAGKLVIRDALGSHV